MISCWCRSMTRIICEPSMNEKPQPARWLNRNDAGMALASFFSDLVTLIPGMLATLAFWRGCMCCWSSMSP